MGDSSGRADGVLALLGDSPGFGSIHAGRIHAGRVDTVDTSHPGYATLNRGPAADIDGRQPTAAHAAASQHESAAAGAKGDADNVDHAWGVAEEDEELRDLDADMIVTLNLPLMGVLRTIDASSGQFKQLLSLAVKEFMEHSADAPTEGLFMTRCDSATAQHEQHNTAYRFRSVSRCDSTTAA
jgi:hypothetical protein